MFTLYIYIYIAIACGVVYFHFIYIYIYFFFIEISRSQTTKLMLFYLCTNLNKLSKIYQSCTKSTKIDAFEVFFKHKKIEIYAISQPYAYISVDQKQTFKCIDWIKIIGVT